MSWEPYFGGQTEWPLPIRSAWYQMLINERISSTDLLSSLRDFDRYLQSNLPREACSLRHNPVNPREITIAYCGGPTLEEMRAEIAKLHLPLGFVVRAERVDP